MSSAARCVVPRCSVMGCLPRGRGVAEPAQKVTVDRYPELGRRLDPVEFDEARKIAAELGLRRLDERRPH